jgi:hypothetical protein
LKPHKKGTKDIKGKNKRDEPNWAIIHGSATRVHLLKYVFAVLCSASILELKPYFTHNKINIKI